MRQWSSSWRKRVLTIPLPWVFDWSALNQLDADACAPLTQLFRHWAPQPLDMRWIGGEQLLNLLAEAAPVGVRDADPALWQLRLQFLRLCNRPDRFDEVAIDYCVTYEVSPPSWEPAQCQVRISGPAGAPTNVAPLTAGGRGQHQLCRIAARRRARAGADGAAGALRPARR